MRAAIVTHSYWPEHSPPQRRWSGFSRALIESGWTVDVVAPTPHYQHSHEPLEEISGGIFPRDRGPFGETIRRVPYLKMPNTRLGRLIDQLFSATLSIPALVRGTKPDLIVATVPSLPVALAAHVAATLMRVPLVLDMRDAWPDLAREAKVAHAGTRSAVEQLIMRIQRNAALVITVTEGFAQTLRKRGVKNVITVSNGVDTSRVVSLDAPPLDSDRLEVLYLGNHGESQRLDHIIRAAALAGSKVHLTMIGNGVEKPRLKLLAKKLKAPVTFFPSVSGVEAVTAAYRKADTCVVSLRDDWQSFESTVPSKTYEVIATGRHVTGIVKGEAENILKAADAGDIVRASPAAIAALWDELASNRHRLKTNGSGRNWVEQNADSKKLGQKMVEVLQTVAVGKSNKDSVPNKSVNT